MDHLKSVSWSVDLEKFYYIAHVRWGYSRLGYIYYVCKKCLLVNVRREVVVVSMCVQGVAMVNVREVTSAKCLWTVLVKCLNVSGWLVWNKAVHSFICMNYICITVVCVTVAWALLFWPWWRVNLIICLLCLFAFDSPIGPGTYCKSHASATG